MDLGLSGRAAIVTGSSRGLGKAIAHDLAREGARVALTYRRGREQAQATAAEIHDFGGTAMTVELDLACPDSIATAVNAVDAAFNRIDILVNNAIDYGPRAYLPFDRLPATHWRRLLRTNIEGPYAATQAVVPAMRRQNWGRIVSISSIAAYDGLAGGVWYSTAKSALDGLTAAVTKELAGCGILANIVVPGLTVTGSTDAIPRELRDQYVRATPIGRLLHANEIAPLVVFLCSAVNTGITGQVIRASGGC
jgi:NAD(P)-dependent dehydrogenase (short-subunit alcohol dehydrogenase family)